ncbi:MAG: prepilin-type N-terminal cleavage/methylation domain-containing protein [Archangium sp.]
MKRRGMTILELMVVVAIVGVMSSLSVYGFDRLTRVQRQTGALRELSMQLLEARAEARLHNQPVRFELATVPTGTRVRWGRLPCGDAWGRSCPSTACTSTTTCGGTCVCDSISSQVIIPNGVTITGLNGLCFLGSTGAPRGATCQQSGTPVSTLRFDLADQPTPYLMVLEPLSGNARLVDCSRLPKDPSCP